MAGLTLVVSSFVGPAVVVRTAVAGHHHGRWTVDPRPSRPAPSCRSATTNQPRTNGETPRPVRVSVAPTVLIELGRGGRVDAAWTNTGCPPRASDDIFVREVDGRITRAGNGSIARRRWIGDFAQPGRFVDQ